MTVQIAITGTIYSGKTTLAKHLRDKYGFIHVNFSDVLKRYACMALEGVGVKVRVSDIVNNKDRYRAFLQELGVLMDFDTNPEFVYEAVTPHSFTTQPVVFEAVRTKEQADTLHSLGFKIVKLCLPKDEQIRRARDLGVDGTKLLIQLMHPVEQGFDNFDLTLDATQPIEYNAETIVTMYT